MGELVVLQSVQREDPLSRPVVDQEEVFVPAGETKPEVPQRTAGAGERPASHHAQDHVGGDQTAFVLRVHERLERKNHVKESLSFYTDVTLN